MNLEQAQSILRLHRINPAKLLETKLIKLIQINRGDLDCFASANGECECDHTACLWREKCFAAAQHGGMS